MEIPKNIEQIMVKLLTNKFEAYVIGGAVRDFFLGLEPNDYDIFTNASGRQILKLFPEGKVVGGEERQKKILTVLVEGVEGTAFMKPVAVLKIGKQAAKFFEKFFGKGEKAVIG